MIGAGRLSRRSAVRYATAMTFLGSAAALPLARGQLARFSGKGLLGPELAESVGALVGIGALRGSARWKTVGAILASWLVTLPLAAALAAVLWLVLA